MTLLSTGSVLCYLGLVVKAYREYVLLKKLRQCLQELNREEIKHPGVKRLLEGRTIWGGDV